MRGVTMRRTIPVWSEYAITQMPLALAGGRAVDRPVGRLRRNHGRDPSDPLTDTAGADAADDTGLGRRVRRPRELRTRPDEGDVRPGQKHRLGQSGTGDVHERAPERAPGRRRAPDHPRRAERIDVHLRTP